MVIPERASEMLAKTSDISGIFQNAGKELYIVGGTVRDLILAGGQDDESGDTSRNESGKVQSGGVDGAAATGNVEGNEAGGAQSTKDYDFATNALPDETLSLVKDWADNVWMQGKKFGTIACLKGNLRFEITTYRAEVYSSDTRKPAVVFGESLEDDLIRRDFTVNSMALALPSLELIDPFGGLSDLASSTLRTPREASKSFDEDPLRMLRAARFIAGYHLQPVGELTAAVSEMAARIEVVSPERIRDELDKLLVVRKPSPGLAFLVDTGLAERFMPELPALALEQDPIHHHKDVLAHTLAVVDRTSSERLLRLAALFHDIGKPKTRTYTSQGVSFHHHDVVGARMARERMRKLRYSTEDVSVVSKLVGLHLRFHTYRFGWTDSALRRYVRDAGPLLQWLNELTRCDCTTRNPVKARELNERMDELESRIAELRQREEIESIRPDLDGVQVMERLGIAPGREVGEALAFLLELRMDQGPLPEDEAYRKLDEWWQGRNS